MTTPPLKLHPTLNGVFQLPKVNHKRDFLRENKLSLKQLERITYDKQKAEEKRQQQHLLKVAPLQVLQKPSATNELHSNKHRTSRTRLDVVGKTRSLSALRSDKQLVSFQRCPSCQGSGSICGSVTTIPQQQATSTDSTSNASHSKRCHMATQTDDLFDEKYLIEALKRCTAAELEEAAAIKKQTKTEISIDNDSMRISNSAAAEQTSNAQTAAPHQGKVLDDNISVNSARSQTSQTALLRKQSTQYCMQSPKTIYTEQLPSDTQKKQTTDAQLTSRSGSSSSLNTEATVIEKKKSDRSIPPQAVAASRNDVRLPRYLWREKLEKEEQRQRELNRDPNCPYGYYAISESDRQMALQNANYQFNELIAELNRLPMTTQTLRVKNRKTEIEKQLIAIEQIIRDFSKPKVYMKMNEIPS